jgi:hypothetical protein
VSILFLLLVSLMNSCYGTEYIYPIGIVPHSCESKILFMHQHTDRRMQVFLWDSSARTYELGLSSQYNPVGVQLLANGSGFSFIDNGIVKIKIFNKRSAKIIEMYEPLYNIANIIWISETEFLFQAQRGNRYGIYQADLEGNVSTIQADTYHDYGYPALIDTKLFYISKDADNTYCIAHTSFLNDEDTTSSIYTSDYPLMHLTMFTTGDGYVLEKRGSDLVICYFKKENGEWRFEDIFCFKDDTRSFFDNNFSLCEILRPFLPCRSSAGLFLPLVANNFFNDVSYYDIEKRCLLRHKCSPFFLPPFFDTSAAISFFGCPLMVNNECFVGIAVKG